MRGAMPSGCRLRRRTLTGGSSRCAAAPSIRSGTARLAETSPQWRSTTTAGIGLVAAQDAVDRLAHRAHLRRVEVVLGVGGRVAGGEQQRVAVAQRDVEMLGQLDHHLRARLGPPRLDEAQVPGRHARLEREVLLAHPPPAAPVAQQASDAGAVGDRGGHGRHASGGPAAGR